MSLKLAFKTFQSLLGICVIQNGFTLESWVLKLHKIPSVACFTIRLRFCHGTETLASFKLRFLLLTCLNHLPILYLGGNADSDSNKILCSMIMPWNELQETFPNPSGASLLPALGGAAEINGPEWRWISCRNSSLLALNPPTSSSQQFLTYFSLAWCYFEFKY